jgi:hypothetical protein
MVTVETSLRVGKVLAPMGPAGFFTRKGAGCNQAGKWVLVAKQRFQSGSVSNQPCIRPESSPGLRGRHHWAFAFDLLNGGGGS